MQFAAPNQPDHSPDGSPRRERPFWRRLLFVAAAATVIAATRPWTRVEFTRLFGEVFGPPAWQNSTAGFTCLCTSALLAVMALVETRSSTTREAVRPASLLLAAVMVLSVVLYISRGPGMLRGVSAMWTPSLYIGAATSLLVLAACAARFVAMRPQRKPGT